MALHIGKLVKKHIEQAGMNKSEFARRINSTPQNVYSIFKRKSMDTDLLKDISKVLGYDFFQHYTVSSRQAADDLPSYRSATEMRTDIEKMKKEADLLRQENKYLREINNLLRTQIYGTTDPSEDENDAGSKNASPPIAPKKRGPKKKSG